MGGAHVLEWVRLECGLGWFGWLFELAGGWVVFGPWGLRLMVVWSGVEPAYSVAAVGRKIPGFLWWYVSRGDNVLGLFEL